MFSLVACFQDKTPEVLPEETPERVSYTFDDTLSTQGTVTGNGITITFDKTADWDAGNGNRGFTANVTVINNTSTDLNNWDLKFDFLASISNMWNASYTQTPLANSPPNTTGKRFTITPASWNANIQKNQSRSFGFQGSYTGVFQDPSSYVLSGIPVGQQTPPSPVTPTCTLSTQFIVNSNWQNGDGTKGFVAELKLTNTGTSPVNWQLAFNLNAQITNMWNASYSQTPAATTPPSTTAITKYTVTPASWNTRIEPNQTISFGFQGSYTTSSLSNPSNFVCNGQEQEKPYDPFEGFNLPDKLPTISEESGEQILQRYNEALAALSPESRRLLAEGELVFNGYTFGPRSPVGGAYVPEGLGTQQTLTPQPQSPFECFLNEGDQILKKNNQGAIEYDPITGEPIYLPGKKDFGTFYHLGSRTGTGSAPVSNARASLVLPTKGKITNPDPDNQRPYVMITGRSPAIGPAEDGGVYGANFDAGLGYD
jgi:hypothetical protein